MTPNVEADKAGNSEQCLSMVRLSQWREGLVNYCSKEHIMDASTRDHLCEFLTFANALLDSMDTGLHADATSMFKHASFKIYMRKYNQLVEALPKTTLIDTIIDRYDLDRVPGSHDTTLIHQKELFDSVHANLSILKAYLENKLGLKEDRIQSLTNFFQANLRKVVFSVPEREVDVQNAVEQLLIGRGFEKGIDYDRETGRIKVSIKEVVPDFILPKLGLAIEVKLSKDKSKSKAIVDEINSDIMAYGKGYPSILFIVYDMSSIRDEVEFKHDLEASEGVSVIIVKH